LNGKTSNFPVSQQLNDLIELKLETKQSNGIGSLILYPGILSMHSNVRFSFGQTMMRAAKEWTFGEPLMAREITRGFVFNLRISFVRPKKGRFNCEN